MPFFSVIVPIYNTEKYLKKCVESVLTQSFKDYELILIDDGSPDECGKICDQYQRNNAKIKVWHKKNGGLSDARNTGIQYATGEYILFLDSDDFWNDVRFLECVKQEIDCQKCDVLNYHYQYFNEDKNEYKIRFSDISKDEFLKLDAEGRFLYLVEQDQFIASACNKAVARNLILSHGIFFEEGITAEDIEWCARIAANSHMMGGCNLNAYCYRQRASSITHSIRIENVEMLRNNVIKCIEQGERLKRSKTYKKAFLSYVAYQYGTLLFHINCFNKTERKEQLSLAEPYKYLLAYGKNRKVFFLRAFNRIFGFYGMNFILRMFIILSSVNK